MNNWWDALNLWPVRVLLAGGVVLLVGRVLLMVSRQPARRVWIGTAAVVAALLAIPLSLVPAWVHVSVPTQTVVESDGARSGSEGEGESAKLVREVPSRSGFQPDRMPVMADPQTGKIGIMPPHRGGDIPMLPESAASSSVQPVPITSTGQVENLTYTVNWLAILAGAYGLVVLALIVRLVCGHLVLNKLWRSAHPAPAWAESVFRRLAASACPRAQLRISARGGGPICFGIVRPRVLAPAALLAQGDGPLLRAVLAHELAHLGRRDPLAGWLLGLARAAYFVCPWLAGLRREVRVAQECLADASAIAHGAGPTEYAELLIRMARARPAPLGSAGARGSSSELYRRVTMLLRTQGRVEARCPRRWAVALGGGLTALAILAAGLAIQPASAAEPEKKPADKKEVEKKDVEKKEAPKPAARPDLLKEMLEKLQKDAGDDPEAKKKIEELKKALQPVPAPDGVPPGVGRAPDGVRPVPLFPQPVFPDEAMLKDLLKDQAEMLRQLQGVLGQPGGGLRIRGGFNVGPDGVTPVLTPIGGVRLGVRVERPSDVLASQLDLPAGQGLVCTDVPAESVAGKAGIRPHDILMELAGKPVSSSFPDFQKAIAEVKADTAIDIVVLRKGKKETIKGVKLPEAKAQVDLPGFPGGIDNPFPVLPPVRIPGPVGVPPGTGTTVVAGPGETVRVEQVNDAFTVFYTKNGVKVTIAGSKDGGVAKPESIEIEEGGKTTRAESIDKLPKEMQELAKNAMKAVK
ncbi:MAG TPA: M56 family metallopeptidase [Gemmataceae bacterium]|jgi:beta-lactamase regulating signal transducer with metallopeptidase domain|nr:M56 family metallopeptidase [Gemmataceae bacterium]